jgi:hypothetical protein
VTFSDIVTSLCRFAYFRPKLLRISGRFWGFWQDPGISQYMSDPNADGLGLENRSMFDPNADESSKILANVRSLVRTKPICIAMSDPDADGSMAEV